MTQMTLLIVDDARSERILLRHALTDVRRNLQIFEAGNHQETMLCLQKHNVDGIFLDIQLPGYNGIEILEDILSLRPGLPVVMVSHHSTQDLVVKAIRLGAIGYLVKPFNLAKLRGVLEKIDSGQASEETMRTEAQSLAE